MPRVQPRPPSGAQRGVTRPLEVRLAAQELLFAESIHAPGFRMPWRRDPFHKLIFVVRGEVAIERQGDETHAAGEGTLHLLVAGTRHRILDTSPATLLLLCGGVAVVAADPGLSRLWPELVRQRSWRSKAFTAHEGQFVNLWRRALLEQSLGLIGAGLLIHSLAMQIFVRLARQQHLPGAASEPAGARVAQTLREISETFYDDWNVDRAAARAGLSRRRFTELFRRQTGRSLGLYLNGLRLDHAATLLKRGDTSVTGAAFSCGFGDLSHFHRKFRARFGRTPGSLGP